MKRHPILEVCARIEGHDVQYGLLRGFCKNFDDWQELLEQAEREGMAPLLRNHLIDADVEIPATARRSLALLYKRHQNLAQVRLQVLEDALVLFIQHQLTPILIKGSALCIKLYPDPALRPMRDMDILFDNEEVDSAQELLKNCGFEESTAPIPAGHHHLPSLHKTVDGVNICFELHRGLYPDITPHYPEVDFKQLRNTAQTVQVGKVTTLAFSHEETLHYLYQHTFRQPLTYEPYKLISVADIISYTEKYYDEINWDEIRERFPDLSKALPLMHHVAPWNFNRIPHKFLSRRDKQHHLAPKPFCGWPRKNLDELKQNTSIVQIIVETFFPSRWWMSVYYGKTGILGYIRALFRTHIVQLTLFARFYRK